LALSMLPRAPLLPVFPSPTLFRSADFVYVKNWSSFNDYGKILPVHQPWLLTEDKLKQSAEAKVMHCLPVRRNLELSDEILDGSRSEEHTSELQSRENYVCRLLLEK